MAFIHNPALLKEKKVTGSAVFRHLFSSAHKRVPVFITAPVRPLRCPKLRCLMAPGTISSSKRYPESFRLYLVTYLMCEKQVMFICCVLWLL